MYSTGINRNDWGKTSAQSEFHCILRQTAKTTWLWRMQEHLLKVWLVDDQTSMYVPDTRYDGQIRSPFFEKFSHEGLQRNELTYILYICLHLFTSLFQTCAWTQGVGRDEKFSEDSRIDSWGPTVVVLAYWFLLFFFVHDIKATRDTIFDEFNLI